MAVGRFLILLTVFLPVQGRTQNSGLLDVCDLTLPVAGLTTQELYYAFAAGDELLIHFSEDKAKADWEVEVAEYPEHVIFRDYQVGEIRGKALNVPRTAVYRFTIRNTVRRDRICRLRLQRRPAGEATRAFITAVDWVERPDTVYRRETARMERRRVALRRQVLTGVDTAVLSLLERTERVHSIGNLSNKATATIQSVLPANQRGDGYETELVSWAYWIGVGGEAEQQFQQANQAVRIARAATKAAVEIGLLSSGYGALAVLAIEGVSFFIQPARGDNVRYRILGGDQLLDQGDGIASYARQSAFTQGTVTIELTNDNLIDALNAQVRLVAVVVTRHFREEVLYEERDVPVFDTVFTVKRVPVVRRE